MILRFLLACLLLTPALPAAEPLRLALPPVLHAVAGQPFEVYFDNLVLAETSEALSFRVSCPLGSADARRWRVLPEAGQAGEHAFQVEVSDPRDGRRETAQAVLRVAPATAGADRALRLLIVGDSLTNASHYPNEIARLLAQPGNPRTTLLGTHRPASAAAGVAHEGYGGWTWKNFLQKWDAEPATATAGPVRRARSPFLYAGTDGQPALDVARYFRDQGGAPDAALFLLGINDCFSADPNQPEAIDARITEVLGHADQLLAAFRAAAPKAALAVGLTTPPNARESGFEANYKGRYKRWGWKRIQHRLVERMIAHFGGREQEGLHLVATELVLDPVDGYPVDNGVHPNPAGYAQIGAGFHGWLKIWLADGAPGPAATGR